MSLLFLCKTQISALKAKLKKPFPLKRPFPYFSSSLRTCTQNLSIPPRTWSSDTLELFPGYCGYISSFLLDRARTVDQLNPLLCVFGYTTLFLYSSLFIVIGNVRSTLYHVLLPHLEGIQVQKFMLFTTDTLLNSEGVFMKYISSPRENCI